MDTQFHMPRWNQLPTVDLYLDQVVTLINSTLSPFIFSNINNNQTENQILTKTMINNYVKNKLIEAPNKKKYSKVQLAKLIVICVLKQVYSMTDIQILIDIALNNSNIEEAYTSFCNQFEEALQCTYTNKEFTIIVDSNHDKNLLKSVLFSCTYKIYAQTIINENKNGAIKAL